MPLQHGDRLVAIQCWDAASKKAERRILHEFIAWREELKSIEDLGAFRTIQRNLIAADGPAEPVAVAEITASAFPLAGVRPWLGRYLTAEDERSGAPPVIIVGFDVWKTRFASDPAVVGRTLQLGDTQYTVVGVTPERFAFPLSHRFWIPLRADPRDYDRRKGPELMVFGRLAPGATRESAQAELTTYSLRASAAMPKTHEHLRLRVMPYKYPLIGLDDVGERWELYLMQILVTLLLMVICANVAILVYARAATGQGEIMVRTALGASRRRIMTQLFAEALVLAGIAAAAGLAIADVGLQQAHAIMHAEMGSPPFWVDVRPTSTTLTYVVGLALVAQ